MPKPKLIRVTTVPESLEKLLEGQLNYMQKFFDVVAVSADKERLENFGRKNRISTFHVEMTRKITPLSDIKATYRLFKYFRKEKPAIVHTHTPKAGVAGMIAAKFAGVPIRLHTVAGLPLMEAKGLKRWVLNTVEKLTYSCATKILPNSEGLKKFILEHNFTKSSKLKIIGRGSSNGIDTSYFDPELFTEEQKNNLRKKYHIPKDAFIFIFIGRLVGDKGINELVSAFKHLIQNNEVYPEPHLLLVGSLESELDPLLPATWQEIEINSRIINAGYQQDVRPFLAISNALTFPSYREGFPNVVMQAGAMGLPAIVSNINGCNEIIKENKNGLIVPPKDTAALQEAMNCLLQNEDLRNQLKKRARKRIVEHYQRSEIWNSLLLEYQELLKDKAISISQQ